MVVILILPNRPFLARNAATLAEGATGTIDWGVVAWYQCLICSIFILCDSICPSSSRNGRKSSEAEAAFAAADIIRVVIGPTCCDYASI
jgi:hypothetical protein